MDEPERLIDDAVLFLMGIAGLQIFMERSAAEGVKLLHCSNIDWINVEIQTTIGANLI